MNSPLRYRLAAQTHIGMKRSGNEDNFGIFDAPRTDAAFVVADGMGGLQAGDVASAEAVRTIEQVLQERLADPSVDPSAALAEAIHRANDAVNALPRAGAPVEEPTLTSAGGGSDARKPTKEFVASTALMGTTAIAGIVRDGTLYLAHAGDSRAYLLRDNQLQRLTDDHSFVAERVKTGDMTEAEARRSRFRNMITRAIGIEATIQPDLIQETLQAEDLLLVCTDGLTTMLEDSDIAEILRAPRFVKQSLEQQVSALIDAANRRGGSDNTTVLLLRPQPEQKSAAESSPAPAPRRETSVTSRMTAADLSARQAVAAPSTTSSRRRESTHPILVLLALVGGAALLAALGVSVSPDLRRALAANLQLMNGTPPQNGPRPIEQLAGLVYDPPTEFAREVLARGDLLAYVPGVGLYFATNSTGKVACLDKKSEIVATFPTLEIAYRPTPAGEQFKTQTFLTGDGQGNLYVCHTERRLVEKFDRNGKLLWRSSSNPQIHLERPEAIAVDDEGNLYIVDTNHIRVLRARPRSDTKEAGAPASPSARGGVKP